MKTGAHVPRGFLAALLALAMALPALAGAASSRNTGLELTVHGHAIADRYAGREAPPGRQFLLLDVEFRNVIPATLVFERDVPQQIGLPRLRHKLFLLAGGKRVYRLDEALQAEPGHLPDSLLLHRHGASARGHVVFEIGAEAWAGGSLHYFNDQFGPLEVNFGPTAALAPPPHAQANQVVTLGVQGLSVRSEVGGVRAPAGQEFVVLHLAGKGGFTTPTPAYMLDENAGDADVAVDVPFEFPGARSALQMVADGNLAASYDSQLSSVAEVPAFLPTHWSELELVFPVPAARSTLALEVLFPRMGVGDQDAITPAPLSFELEAGTPPAPPASLFEFMDGDRVNRFSIGIGAPGWGDQAPEEMERDLQIIALVSYHGPEPARDRMRRRFFLVLPGGATLAMHPEGPAEMVFVDGTQRRLNLRFAVPAGIERAHLAFSGPSKIVEIPLSLNADSAEFQGEAQVLTREELEARALVRVGDDGQVAPSENLDIAVRRPELQELKTDWKQKWLVVRGGTMAELAVRVGDVDNFGFGWEVGFDPFASSSTRTHPYPWQPDPRDPPGTDRIMVGSGYQGRGTFDGYASGTKRPTNTVQDIVLSFAPDEIEIQAAKLRMFLDDFQPARLKSRFQVFLDGQRVSAIEEIINELNQTGPVGKLVTVDIPAEYLPLLADGTLSIRIDDFETGVGDGYAVDFVELLVNPTPAPEPASARGVVTAAESGSPVREAVISAPGARQVTTDAEGRYLLDGIPAGLVVISAASPGFMKAAQSVDLEGSDVREVNFELRVENSVEALRDRGRAVLRGIRFDTGSSKLRPEAATVLQELLSFMQEDAGSNYRIEGHTDSEGNDADNIALSRARSEAVTSWLVEHGIDRARLSAEGFGESRPVAGNDTETGRALNRRVEILVVSNAQVGAQ